MAGGSVSCWGYENYFKTMPLDGGFAYVGAGWNHSCGLRPNGSVSCWGEDDHEQFRPPEVLIRPTQHRRVAQLRSHDHRHRRLLGSR